MSCIILSVPFLLILPHSHLPIQDASNSPPSWPYPTPMARSMHLYLLVSLLRSLTSLPMLLVVPSHHLFFPLKNIISDLPKLKGLICACYFTFLTSIYSSLFQSHSVHWSYFCLVSNKLLISRCNWIFSFCLIWPLKSCDTTSWNSLLSCLLGQ